MPVPTSSWPARPSSAGPRPARGGPVDILRAAAGAPAGAPTLTAGDRTPATATPTPTWMRAGRRRGRDGPRAHVAQSVGGGRRGPVGVRPDGPSTWFAGATAPPGGPHAEVAALAAAGERARGGTLYVTLEPCAHHGRTPPCTDAIVAAGRPAGGRRPSTIPTPRSTGAGIAALRAAGVEVEVGVAADAVGEQLAPYVNHRRTGRPWVVLKLAATLDGRIAAPDGTSRWITGRGGPARRPPAAGPCPTPCWWERARCGPTTRP